jgi:shikimate kinase
MLEAKNNPLTSRRASGQEGRHPCISLIGMPGSGKSTLGTMLASEMGWAFVDTDHVMEAWFGLVLEEIRNRLGREKFLQAEERTILSLNVNRSVIATGGSVIYSRPAMQALKNRGVVIYLQADYEIIQHRVAQNPDRGLVLGINQTLLDLFQERTPRYEAYADLRVRTDELSLETCARHISEWFESNGPHLPGTT